MWKMVGYGFLMKRLTEISYHHILLYAVLVADESFSTFLNFEQKSKIVKHHLLPELQGIELLWNSYSMYKQGENHVPSDSITMT